MANMEEDWVNTGEEGLAMKEEDWANRRRRGYNGWRIGPTERRRIGQQ